MTRTQTLRQQRNFYNKNFFRKIQMYNQMNPMHRDEEGGCGRRRASDENGESHTRTKNIFFRLGWVDRTAYTLFVCASILTISVWGAGLIWFAVHYEDMVNAIDAGVQIYDAAKRYDAQLHDWWGEIGHFEPLLKCVACIAQRFPEVVECQLECA